MVEEGSLLNGTSPEMLQSWWEAGGRFLEDCEDGSWTPAAHPNILAERTREKIRVGGE